MNARVYDNVIGRFLSADTIIQAPDDSQSYNRYSYVRNNPLMYTDPSGHSWLSSAWHSVSNNFRTIAAVAIVAVLAVYTGGAALGALGYGSAAAATAAGTTIAAGASVSGLTAIVLSGAAAGFVGGFAGGLLSGASVNQSLKTGFKGALWGAVSAGVANGIGTAFSGGGASLAHGLTRAAISKAQGGKYSEGFWSGFASSALGGTIGKFKTMEGQVSMAAIVGGTASKLGGGKFANGAVSGAFVHMYNYTAHLPKWMPEAGNRAEQEYTSLKVMNSVSRFFLYAGDVIGEAFNGGLNGYRVVRDGTNPEQPAITIFMLKGGMTAVEMGLTNWMTMAEYPLAHIWYNTTSGAYMDTYPHLNIYAYASSIVSGASSMDTTWFK
jgi:hypothetical protein